MENLKTIKSKKLRGLDWRLSGLSSIAGHPPQWLLVEKGNLTLCEEPELPLAAQWGSQQSPLSGLSAYLLLSEGLLFDSGEKSASSGAFCYQGYMSETTVLGGILLWGWKT